MTHTPEVNVHNFACTSINRNCFMTTWHLHRRSDYFLFKRYALYKILAQSDRLVNLHKQ